MKRIFAAILVALFLAIGGQVGMPSSNVCYAEVYYVNDDENYPIWAAGSRYVSTYDLSSCFVYHEDNDYVIVKTIGYTYDRVEHTFSQPTETYFRMDKSSHKVWFKQSNVKWYNAGIFDDAILLAFRKVGIL